MCTICVMCVLYNILRSGTRQRNFQKKKNQFKSTESFSGNKTRTILHRRMTNTIQYYVVRIQMDNGVVLGVKYPKLYFFHTTRAGHETCVEIIRLRSQLTLETFLGSHRCSPIMFIFYVNIFLSRNDAPMLVRLPVCYPVTRYDPRTVLFY